MIKLVIPKLLLLGLLSLVMAGCYFPRSTPHPRHFVADYGTAKLRGSLRRANHYLAPAPQIQVKQFKVATFNSLIVTGDFEVKIKSGPQKVTVSDWSTDFANYALSCKDHTLFISKSSFDHKAGYRPIISITNPNLKYLRVGDNAKVSAKDLLSDGLQIVADGYGSVHLQGKIALERVIQNGYGKIDVSWISIAGIAVECNAKGPVYLAGVVTNLYASLHNGGVLDARYLRSREAEVIVIDGGEAKVLPIDWLRAYAINNSNIFYYKIPAQMTVVTKDRGAVLHHDWMR